MSKLVKISAELVEDLSLHRFVIRHLQPYWGDYYLIDARRKKRELRRLSKLRAESLERFMLSVPPRAAKTLYSIDTARDNDYTAKVTYCLEPNGTIHVLGLEYLP